MWVGGGPPGPELRKVQAEILSNVDEKVLVPVVGS